MAGSPANLPPWEIDFLAAIDQNKWTLDDMDFDLPLHSSDLANRQNFTYNPSNNFSIPPYSANPNLDPSKRMEEVIMLIYGGFLALFGMVVNIGCLIQFMLLSALRRRESSSAHYVLAICVADITALTQLGLGLVTRLMAKNDKIPHPSDQWCRMSSFLGFLGQMICPWFILALTVERFLVIRKPLNRNAIVSVTRARIIILSIFVAGVAYNAWILVFYHVEELSGDMWSCTVVERMWDLRRIYNILDLTFMFVLPCVSIAGLNVFMCYYLIVRRSRRKTLIGAACTISGLSRMRDHDMRIAQKLVILSVFYFIFNFPFYALRISNLFFASFENFYDNRRLVSKICDLIYSTQYSVHCLTYARAVPTAREHLKATRRYLAKKTSSLVSNTQLSLKLGRTISAALVGRGANSTGPPPPANKTRRFTFSSGITPTNSNSTMFNGRPVHETHSLSYPLAAVLRHDNDLANTETDIEPTESVTTPDKGLVLLLPRPNGTTGFAKKTAVKKRLSGESTRFSQLFERTIEEERISCV